MVNNLFYPQFELSEEEFQSFSRLVHKKAGINLHEGKKELLRARLARRIRDGGFKTFGEYYDLIISDKTGDELVALLDSIATNLTSFFRESKHFGFMENQFLPDVINRNVKAPNPALRIWSAGCSTGEEPYSIALTVMEYNRIFEDWDFKILATDLSTKVLSIARNGVYKKDQVAGVKPVLLRKYFQIGHGRWEGFYRVKKEIRAMISFRRLNLIEPLPFNRRFDLIFCRNVMIYFDKPTQKELVDKFHQVLTENGVLFIGHSESLSGFKHKFKYLQPTIYQKKG